MPAVKFNYPSATGNENTYRWPVFLPDSKHYLFLAANIRGDIELNTLYVGSIDRPSEKQFLIKTMYNADYANGYIFFVRDGAIQAQKLDLASYQLTGNVLRIFDNVKLQSRIFYAAFSASRDAVLAQEAGEVSLSRLIWYNRNGKDLSESAPTDTYANLAISPDGKYIVTDKTDTTNENTDVFIYDPARTSFRRLTFDPGIDAVPVCEMSSGAGPAISWYVSLLVTHPKWGLGKIVHVSEDVLKIYFRDLAEKQAGDACRKIKPRECELRIAEVQSDPWLDNIPPLVDGEVSYSKPRLTLEQQISWFGNRYPHGFNDPNYLKQRNHHWNAHLAYVEEIGNGLGFKTLKQDSLAKLGGQGRRVLGKSKYLSKYEALAFYDAIGGNNAAVAHRFFECLFTLVEAPQLTKANLDLYFAAVCELPWSGPKLLATWPVSTILPFLADPSRFVLLQPEKSKHAAERCPFDLMYDPEPNSRTYGQLLTLCANLLAALTPLGARDYMDAQEFIWTVGEHR